MTTVLRWTKDRAPHGVYIGRAVPRVGITDDSPWANPFRIGSKWHADWGLDRTDVLVLFAMYVDLHPDGIAQRQHAADLRDRSLLCWCCERGDRLNLGDPIVCHGQIWAHHAHGLDLPPEVRPPKMLACRGVPSISALPTMLRFARVLDARNTPAEVNDAANAAGFVGDATGAFEVTYETDAPDA